MSRVRFRHSAAISVAALVTLLGAVPLVSTLWFPALLPVLLIPLAIAVWAWRAGTDADAEAVTVRALLGSRRVPWDEIDGLRPRGRGTAAELRGGTLLALPAVPPAGLIRLAAVSGRLAENDPAAPAEPQ